MTPKERMSLAMQRKVPDRVPVMCQLSIGHMLINSGVKPIDLFTNEGFAKAILKMREKYNFDGIIVYRGKDPDWKEKNITCDTEGKAIIHCKDGSKHILPNDESPSFYPSPNYKRPVIAEIGPEDIEVKPSEYLFEISNMIPVDIKNNYSIHMGSGSPFTSFMEVFGFEQALLSLMDNPNKCKEILERYTTRVINCLCAEAEKGVDALYISSPYGGSSFISKKFYMEFVCPYEKKVISAVKEKYSIPIYNHTCGFIGDRLELIVSTGIDGLECLDPPPLGDVRLADAVKRIGDKVFIKGNIDSTNVLLKGTKKEVIKDAKKRIETAGPGGGYILSTACSTAPYVPPENIKILAEVAQEYGRYDKDGNLLSV